MPVLQDAVTPDQTLHTSATPSNRLFDLIPRLRWVYFVLVAAFMLLSFNGRWRVGRDSAAYRGLGHQLATTGKYVFRDKAGISVYTDQQDTRYPGLPLILAVVEKTLGRSDAASVIVIALMGIATL